MRFNQEAEKRRLKETEPEELLTVVDDAVDAHDEYLRLYGYDGSEDKPSIWLGRASAMDIGHYFLTGENEHITWVDYLVRDGHAPDRENWQVWPRDLSFEEHKRVRRVYEREFPTMSDTYFLLGAMTGALVKLRNKTGWVALDKGFGWHLTPEGMMVADEHAEVALEEL